MKLARKIKDFQYKVGSFLSSPNVKVTINTVKFFSDVFATYNEKKSKWHLLKSLSTGLLDLTENVAIHPYDYFDSEWVEFMYELRGLIHEVIKDYPHVDIKSEEHNVYIRIHDFHGFEIGYTTNPQYDMDHGVQTLWVRVNDRDAVKHQMHLKVWERFKSNHVLLSMSRSDDRHSQPDDVLKFSVDKTIDFMGSKIADDKIDYINRCMVAGINRSFLFYGPPGTGKSTIVKSIIKKLNLRSFRMNLSDLNRHIDVTTIHEVIDMLKPEALVIDDLDRSGIHDDLLNAIEIFHKQFKLILVTANDLNKFDRAMLRPERFDELFVVKSLDETVVKNILGEKLQHMFDQVKLWPVSFINELKNRSLVLTDEELEKSIRELSKRVTSNNTYYDCEPDDEPVDNDSDNVEDEQHSKSAPVQLELLLETNVS